MKINTKKVEIFCGTGGVGKTTLATSRALFLSGKAQRVLLITIDPAKRLKQILGMDDAESGLITEICGSTFGYDKNTSFKAMLMSPRATLRRMGDKTQTLDELNNPIIDILTRPYGGMNEILATVELQINLSSGEFDTIILDTPPGKHFIDFLLAARKIDRFFDKTFVEIFKYLGKSFGTESSAPKRIVGLIISSGIKKLLAHLEKVTGPEFVQTFIDAIIVIYKNREVFLSALHFQKELENKEISNWFLVTSAEQHKIKDAAELKNLASTFMHEDSFLAINKCNKQYIHDWSVTLRPEIKAFRQAVENKEDALLEYASQHFKKGLEFPEILALGPREHVVKLAEIWENYQN